MFAILTALSVLQVAGATSCNEFQCLKGACGNMTETECKGDEDLCLTAHFTGKSKGKEIEMTMGGCGQSGETDCAKSKEAADKNEDVEIDTWDCAECKEDLCNSKEAGKPNQASAAWQVNAMGMSLVVLLIWRYVL